MGIIKVKDDSGLNFFRCKNFIFIKAKIQCICLFIHFYSHVAFSLNVYQKKQ